MVRYIELWGDGEVKSRREIHVLKVGEVYRAIVR